MYVQINYTQPSQVGDIIRYSLKIEREDDRQEDETPVALPAIGDRHAIFPDQYRISAVGIYLPRSSEASALLTGFVDFEECSLTRVADPIDRMRVRDYIHSQLRVLSERREAARAEKNRDLVRLYNTAINTHLDLLNACNGAPRQ